MKNRVLFGVLFTLLAIVPAALLGWSVRGFAEEPAKANPPVALHDDGTLADAAPKTPEQIAAEKREEQEFFEMYKALADTVDQVDRNYVKKIDRRELMEAAIKGVLSKLDPYSSYIGPDDASRFRDTVESQFGGIGIQIVADEGQIKILSPLVGSPAYKAGIQAGDRIVKIGNQSAIGMQLDDAVHKLKGDVGTSVTLTVAHAGGKEETFTLNREVIHVDTVLGDHRKADDAWQFMLDPQRKIGYIRITTFSRDTAGDLKKAMLDLKARKLRGLILDLRFNPGGLLTAAVDTCDMFLNGGRIVSTEGRNSPKRVWDASKKSDAFVGFPMVILVNHYSASASEIVSACLQDHQRAVVIGDRTWGKGSVQNVIELEDGKSLLKLTTASYKRPNGHNIHRFPDSKETDEWGVMPNPGFEVKLDEEEMGELLADRRERDILLPHKRAAVTLSDGKKPDAESQDENADESNHSRSHFVDRQLQKAIDYLTTELAKAS